jgi:hypothetical protein
VVITYLIPRILTLLTTKAITCTKYGYSAVFQTKEVPKPTTQANEILVKNTLANGVNYGRNWPQLFYSSLLFETNCKVNLKDNKNF